MDQKMNAREEALLTLMDIEKNGKKSHIAINECLMRYQFAPKQDRAFFTRLCEGVLERRIYLDYVLDHFSSKPMKSCKPLIRNLLRMGAYQILFMDVRDAAACNEAVKLARKRRFQSLSGFVNGVLRSLIRSKEEVPEPDRDKDPIFYLHIMYSMPIWIVRLLVDSYGEEYTQKILASFLVPRPVTIRTNLSRIHPGDLQILLQEEGMEVERGHFFPEAFTLRGINYLDGYESFQKGYYWVQDESSMFPAALADIRKGDTVLDLCAAPGGKTLQAADRLQGSGLVIARDLTESKIEYIEENLERMGFKNVRPQVRDAQVFDGDMEGQADLVLADLPCSGLGVMGRKSDIRYNLKEEQLGDLVQLQRRILANAWRYVKPGGQLIYSTCTLNPGENEDNVRWILDNTPLVSVSFEDRLPDSLKALRKDNKMEAGFMTLVPGYDPCDGFFVAKFLKPES